MTTRRHRAAGGALATLLLCGAVAACTSADPTGAALPTSAGGPASASSTTSAGSTGSAGSTPTSAQGVTVTLADGARRTWTAAELVTLPRTDVTAADGTPVSGVSLTTIAGLAGSAPSAADAPFVTYEVTGTTGTDVLTRAESDPRVGDHPALLTIIEGSRIDLVVSEDRTPARTLLGVTDVAVRVTGPGAADPSPGPGSVVVHAGGRTQTVALTSLEQRGYALRRPGGPTTQERGARLTEVLARVGVTLTSNQLVTVSGPSGAALLTGGELISNVQEAGFSLEQDGRALPGPVFFLSGDVTAARTVTDATTVTVSG